MRLHLELVESHCGGSIYCGGRKIRDSFIQGEDFYNLSDELASLWEMAARHGMSDELAQDLQDQLLSDYLPDSFNH